MRRMFVSAGLGSAVLAVSLAAIAPTFGPAGAQVVSDEKVSYCHATADVTNPYTLHTTAVASIIQQGHHLQLGPVFPDGGRRGGWGDIIPPFDYFGGSFPGLELLAGLDVLNAGCKVNITPAPPEPPPRRRPRPHRPRRPRPTTDDQRQRPRNRRQRPRTDDNDDGTDVTDDRTTAPESTTTTLGQGENVPTTTLAPGATTVPESTTTTAATTASTTPPTTAPASQWPPAPTLPPGGGNCPRCKRSS